MTDTNSDFNYVSDIFSHMPSIIQIVDSPLKFAFGIFFLLTIIYIVYFAQKTWHVIKEQKFLYKIPLQERQSYVQDILDSSKLSFDNVKLTKQQQYQISIELLKYRKDQSIYKTILAILIIIFLFIIAVYSISSSDDQKPADVIRNIDNLSENDKKQVLQELQNKGYFHTNDKKLVDSLIFQAKDKIRQTNSKYFYSYDSIEAIKELRDLARTRKIPFEPLGEKFKASFPSENDQPFSFTTYVHTKSIYANKILQIYPSDQIHNDKYLILYALAGINDVEEDTFLQLNSQQALYLFGASARPTYKDIYIKEISFHEERLLKDPNCFQKKGWYVQSSQLCNQRNHMNVSTLFSILSKNEKIPNQ